MLRTNLSTRPFYNIRAVQVALGALALLVAVMTLAEPGAAGAPDQRANALSARARSRPKPRRSACAKRPGASDRRSTRRN